MLWVSGLVKLFFDLDHSASGDRINRIRTSDLCVRFFVLLLLCVIVIILFFQEFCFAKHCFNVWLAQPTYIRQNCFWISFQLYVGAKGDVQLHRGKMEVWFGQAISLVGHNPSLPGFSFLPPAFKLCTKCQKFMTKMEHQLKLHMQNSFYFSTKIHTNREHVFTICQPKNNVFVHS